MDSGVGHARDVLLCDRYAPGIHHRSMAVRPKKVASCLERVIGIARGSALGRTPTHAGLISPSGPAVITPPRAARYRLGVCVNRYHSNAQQLPVIYREQVRIGPKTRPRRMV